MSLAAAKKGRKMEEIRNVYDNEKFFKGYLDIRNSPISHNDLIEQPAMEELLPDLKGKTVLDLGCGYGKNTLEFIKRGAKRAVGIDLSYNMVTKAKRENSHPCVDYLNMDMEKIPSLNEKFDVVYSSLAFHYVENFERLVKDIYTLLNPQGVLLFSQEHPLTTATFDGKGDFNKSETGEYLSYTLSNYNQSGKRVVSWIVDGLVKYHRTFSEITNAITDTGFKIIKISEPKPTNEIIEKAPRMAKELIKPSFIIFKATKEQ